MSTVTYQNIQNDTQQLIQSFLNGDECALELSDKVLSTFDLLDTMSYTKTLDHVKGLFNRIKGDRSGNVFALRLPYELSSKEKAVLVRFINISYKGNENIIVLNNNVLYVGSTYDKYDMEKVKEYINQSLGDIHQQYRAQERKEKFNRWKKNFSLFSVYNALRY